MQRVQRVREFVEGVLRASQAPQHVHSEAIHLLGVAQLCSLLALRRGLDPEVAVAAGLLHDIFRCRTGLNVHHAHNSEEEARPYLRDLGVFTLDEQLLIRRAVFRHSSKARVHGPYDELLKDADVLQRYLDNPGRCFDPAAQQRLLRTAAELGLQAEANVAPEDTDAQPTVSQAGFSRQQLAQFAGQLAARQLRGNEQKSGPDVFPLIRYFPGPTPTTQGFDWCAAFVYHCCYQAGLQLPLRYPGVSLRFAAVPAWLEWGRLPAMQCFHPQTETGFTAQPGDLVIFDRLVSDAEHDHIGIVLGRQRGKLLVAEGNVENCSGIFERDTTQHINGYLRIPDGYRYEPDQVEPVHLQGEQPG